MLCSSGALSKKTVAAAIARPACARCLPGHREEKRSAAARVSTTGAREIAESPTEKLRGSGGSGVQFNGFQKKKKGAKILRIFN